MYYYSYVAEDDFVVIVVGSQDSNDLHYCNSGINLVRFDIVDEECSRRNFELQQQKVDNFGFEYSYEWISK